MRTKIYLFMILLLAVTGCRRQFSPADIYRYYWGTKDGYRVWIVDGYTVRENIYNAFLYGGNEQRYPWVPAGEIWIDHAVSCEEFELTLAHELNERHLMAKYGWTYYRAHDSSLRLEVAMRRKYKVICQGHEAALPPMPARDYEGIREIKDIPDSVKLQDIYRVPLGKRDDISVWIVDGYQVRATIFPDFGFSGNDRVYRFIPANEIWIDGQISPEETEYSIAAEILIRNLMSGGATYGAAYDSATTVITLKRKAMDRLINLHRKISIPDSLNMVNGTVQKNEP
jgi:hypothetical protein